MWEEMEDEADEVRMSETEEERTEEWKDAEGKEERI